MTITIARASRDDAFVCAALRLQMDLEAGESNRAGFLGEYADDWLAHYEDLPTWIASRPDGTALGYVQTALVHRPPALARGSQPMLHIGVVFVTPAARGEGLATRLLKTVNVWADERGVSRMMLTSRPKARTLYERAGFGAPGERHMHRDAPFAAAEGMA